MKKMNKVGQYRYLDVAYTRTNSKPTGKHKDKEGVDGGGERTRRRKWRKRSRSRKQIERRNSRKGRSSRKQREEERVEKEQVKRFRVLKRRIIDLSNN